MMLFIKYSTTIILWESVKLLMHYCGMIDFAHTFDTVRLIFFIQIVTNLNMFLIYITLWSFSSILVLRLLNFMDAHLHQLLAIVLLLVNTFIICLNSVFLFLFLLVVFCLRGE